MILPIILMADSCHENGCSERGCWYALGFGKRHLQGGAAAQPRARAVTGVAGRIQQVGEYRHNACWPVMVAHA